MISLCLQWYAIANGLLFVSGLGALPPSTTQPLRRLRLAQLTIALALLLPAVVLWLPTRSLPTVPETIRAPLAEMAGTIGEMTEPARPRPVPRTTPLSATKPSLWRRLADTAEANPTAVIFASRIPP